MGETCILKFIAPRMAILSLQVTMICRIKQRRQHDAVVRPPCLTRRHGIDPSKASETCHSINKTSPIPLFAFLPRSIRAGLF